MDAQREVEIMERAIETYGVDKQVDIAIEEMSELIKALLKFRRGGWSECSAAYLDDIREEMADVSIMLSQLELIYGDVSDIEIEKLERLERRMNCGSQDACFAKMSVHDVQGQDGNVQEVL